MSECKVFRREVEEAADGGSMSAGGRAHISTCRACGDELRERESLRSLVGGLGKVGAPADFEFRLRARLAASKTDRGHGRFNGARWLYGFAPVAVAACFVVVSATLYLRQSPRLQQTAAPAVASAPSPNVEPDRTASVNNGQSRGARSEDVTGEVVKANQPRAASHKTYKYARRVSARAAQAREVASEAEGGADGERRTLVSSVTAAPVLTPIKASAEPLRVIVRDERGAERVVPMRSVSFGSQDFLSRGTSARPASTLEAGGVW